METAALNVVLDKVKEEGEQEMQRRLDIRATLAYTNRSWVKSAQEGDVVKQQANNKQVPTEAIMRDLDV
jgi:hypothetical protein